MGSGVVRDSEKSEVAFLDDFRPRITMGNPIVTEISGVSDVGFSKIGKVSAKKIEKIKIGSNNFKQCPWATQSPNMRSQLFLGPKIIAGEI